MTYRRNLFAVLLALTGVIAACDTTERVADVATPIAPQMAEAVNGVKILRTRAPLPGDVTFRTVTPVGSNGGLLVFGVNSLLVPAGAVSSPTHFSARIHEGEYVRIDLRAWSTSGASVSQFAVPVKLTLDLNTVADYIDDWTKVVVVYHNPNGSLDPVRATVSVSKKTVTATLWHFSDYSPGWGSKDSTTVEP